MVAKEKESTWARVTSMALWRGKALGVVLQQPLPKNLVHKVPEMGPRLVDGTAIRFAGSCPPTRCVGGREAQDGEGEPHAGAAVEVAFPKRVVELVVHQADEHWKSRGNGCQVSHADHRVHDLAG